MFNLSLSTYEMNGHLVVTLGGQLDVADAPYVGAHLTTAVAVYGPWIIVDLEGLDCIDCSSLGVLVRVLRRVQASGGDLSLVAPQGVVRKVLTVTGLMGVFSVYPTVEQAAHGQDLSRAQDPWPQPGQDPGSGQLTASRLLSLPTPARRNEMIPAGPPADTKPEDAVSACTQVPGDVAGG